MVVIQDVPSLGAAPAVPADERSWSDIFKDVVTDAGRTLALGVVDKYTGGSLSRTPSAAELAAIEAARREREAAEQRKMIWIVGGVGAAVLLGAILLRRS